ncbi:hypothetical protein HU200_043552 [Digitaria exilis]|uniref:Uncharacterized protein n=1 Tax=Digitaria exilis TaxID=1010633 RepID=A0A835EHF7_9POAL|nr:hypothetical protein HU200_043552 [Digitaria exilis]
MASGPGRARGGIRIGEPVNVRRDESHSAAAAAVLETPLPAPPFDGLQERVHGLPVPGAGGQNPSADVAASAAAKRKGKKVMAPSPTSSEDSGSPEPSVIVSVSGAGESSPAGSQVDGSGRSNVSWKNPLVEGIMEVPRVTRHIDLQEVFDNVLLQRQWTDTEEMEMQQVRFQGYFGMRS